MSPRIDTALSAVLATARYVLVDFDGPICSIFAGRGAPLIAQELAALIQGDSAHVPDEVLWHTDPLAVLRYAGTVGAGLTEQMEPALQAAELAAAETALPTAGAAEFLAACRRTERPVAIVSNNSTPAIARYLDSHGLAAMVDHIEGRDPNDQGLMKPNPTLVRRSVQVLGGRAELAVLIGDSTSDLEAALAAGIPSIGYANKAGKAPRLAAAGASAVVTNMNELATSLTRLPMPG